jgi:aryl-alcohol dehydrogenase-like predicted oxidoreductase
MQSVEESLRRLHTDYIDIYQQHRFDPRTDPEESLAALGDLIHQGKVRIVGSSSWPAERIVEAQWAAERRALPRFRCEQAPYSLFRRGIERAVLPTAHRYGMGVITYGPLDGSWLTGRYRDKADFTDSSRQLRQGVRFAAFDPDDDVNRRKLELVNHLAKLAADSGLSMSHLATAWALVHPGVTSVILGPRTMEQFVDSLGAADVRLDDDLLDRLDALLPAGTDVASLDPSALPPELEADYRRGRQRS